jgi:methylenetetrahydrofolate reductase (NADPH)
MSFIKNIGRSLDQKFPQLITATGKIVAPPEELIKRVLFSCHMCGQCILHSTGLTRLMRDNGTLESGRKLVQPPRILIGGAIGLTAPPLEFRPHRLAKKIAAGADFVTSQLVFDMDLLKLYMARIRDLGLDEKTYILIGIGALASAGMARAIDQYTPGVVVPHALIKRLERVPTKLQKEEGIKIVVEQIHALTEIPGISGIDLMDLQPESWFPTVEIVERAGLLNRPSREVI